VHQAKCRLVDSIGCAIGALGSPPARIARAIAEQTSSTQPATVFGSRHRTSPELAAFANATMIRYLDYNDMFSSAGGGGGHPSDLISAALAVGESVGSSGEEVLLSIVAGYEVLGRITGVVRLRELGWDQGIHVVVGAAMAAGKLLGLDRDQLGHAISLAIIPNICTRAARVGELSMWKGCATAGATKAGVFAAILAANGMTGPPAPFDGYDGIKHRITGPFDLEMPAVPDRFVIEQVHTKCWPAEYNAQGAIELMLRLREGIDPRVVERIEVATYWLAYSEIGMEPEKWSPHSRETADHSLPYLLAVALLDGDIRVDSFTAERIADPRVHELLPRIGIVEDTDYSARFPGELLCSIVIRLADGTEVSGEIAHPRGHVRNPIGDADLDHKFEGIVASLREPDRVACLSVRSALWKTETVENIGEVLEPLSGVEVPDASRPELDGPARARE
jgi:2-methylcitrate dehydratase